jgi:hypothetical protein
MNPLEVHLFNQSQVNKGNNTMNIILAFSVGIITGIIIYGWYLKRNEVEELDVQV